jgi:protein gp37
VPKQYARPFSEIQLIPERLDEPLHWRKPRLVFVNSMSDLFHADVPDEYICQVFDVMAATPQHQYQVLTKRPGRMASFTGRHYSEPLPNVWLGTSVENQRWASVRLPQLLKTTATIRFLSCEPLLGALDLTLWLSKLDWIIVGGESGPGHRYIDPVWVRSIRDQCVEAGVAFFFKQWGGTTPKARGHMLDGREWNEYPAT